MKFVVTFENNDDEMTTYRQLDTALRVSVAGMRLSLTAGGATDEQIEEICGMIKYHAVSSEEGAQIIFEMDLEKACQRAEEMDLDFDAIQNLGLGSFDNILGSLKDED